MSIFKSRVVATASFFFILLTACQKEPPYWSETELNTLASFQLSRLKSNTDQHNSNQYNGSQHKASQHSNRFANNERAAAFGKQLFFDKRLSLDGSLSCASCHQEDKAFTDGVAKAQGINKTGRNTQTILGAAYLDWFYWDGRKDSLWSQALVPFEAADEMASSRVQVLRTVGRDPKYKVQYEQLFGKFPLVVLDPSIPEQAGPWGDATTRDNWYRIPVYKQKQINHAYANIGKAIAAFERTIPLPQTRFDDYLARLFEHGAVDANTILSADELAGLALFLDQSKTHCLRCHNGPLFSNNDFHNIGTGNFSGPDLDFGRYLGIQAVVQDEFNCLGEYSDAEPEQCLSLVYMSKQVHGESYGAFKTPSLRYLNKTGPYFHDGRFDTLDAVLSHYLSVEEGHSELPVLSLTTDEIRQLAAFLTTLDE